MKYCSKCGSEIDENATFCPNCGNPVSNENNTSVKNDSAAIKTATKVFMVIGCVLSALYFLIPLCWTLPMTIVYFSKTNSRQPISVGFKICTLLFVSLIAGILMLCDKD